MCLIDIMVWILTNNHHTHFVKGAKVKGTEDLPRWRKTLRSTISMAHKISQQLEVGFIKFGL